MDGIKRNTLQTISYFCMACIVFVSLLAVQVKTAESLAILTTPFGGRILESFWCNCSDTLMLTIGPPVPGVFIYSASMSTLYLYYSVWRPGPWTLGNYRPGGRCRTTIGFDGCGGIPVQGQITIVGTSL
jgi:hypothetical protein